MQISAKLKNQSKKVLKKGTDKRKEKEQKCFTEGAWKTRAKRFLRKVSISAKPKNLSKKYFQKDSDTRKTEKQEKTDARKTNQSWKGKAGPEHARNNKAGVAQPCFFKSNVTIDSIQVNGQKANNCQFWMWESPHHAFSTIAQCV